MFCEIARTLSASLDAGAFKIDKNSSIIFRFVTEEILWYNWYFRYRLKKCRSNVDLTLNRDTKLNKALMSSVFCLQY
jgi:hypothetical protein